jgi:hypothetical protein
VKSRREHCESGRYVGILSAYEFEQRYVYVCPYICVCVCIYLYISLSIVYKSQVPCGARRIFLLCGSRLTSCDACQTTIIVSFNQSFYFGPLSAHSKTPYGLGVYRISYILYFIFFYKLKLPLIICISLLAHLQRQGEEKKAMARVHRVYSTTVMISPFVTRIK